VEAANSLVWIALFSSVFIWALGTLFQRKAALGNSIFRFSAIQSLCGALLIGSTTVWDQSLFFAWERIPVSAVLALLYLSLAGTVAAATSYVWLNQNAEPRLVSTYALITPVVAVWLGWMFAGETITAATMGNSLIVIAGVGMIAFSGMARRVRPETRNANRVLTELRQIPLNTGVANR
jgi:drug/metabolite transporter (DMT)-like permease